MLIPGYATPDGTARFEKRFAARLPGHFRNALGLRLSSIGLGTYLGEPTTAYDVLYRDAFIRAVNLGTNVIDSAINYRHQRSERAIGEALAAMIQDVSLKRDEIFLATKGGFLTFDADEPADPAVYFQEKMIQAGIVRPEDVAAGCHVMSPRYLKHQIESSRKNLGVETIDLYYVHNPETQLSEVVSEEFYRRLEAAFAEFEKAVAEGRIRYYGTATWNAYRVGPASRDAMSVEEVLRVAEKVGGSNHHFRAIQLPLNLAMPEAVLAKTQELDGARAPVLQVARAHGLAVFASGSLLQSQLVRGIPPDMQRWFPGLKTDAQRAIQFVRSTPGITTALVGMSQREHVDENLFTATVAPLNLEQYRRIFAQEDTRPSPGSQP
jgi:aryl-alcohol dehydrogenase-like predicted oxidoreductase